MHITLHHGPYLSVGIKEQKSMLLEVNGLLFSDCEHDPMRPHAKSHILSFSRKRALELSHGDSEQLLVNESPSEIAALIQAARDEEWRRQLVCAALPALIQTIGERAPGWMEDCAVKAGRLAFLTMAIYNHEREEERRHADKG